MTSYYQNVNYIIILLNYIKSKIKVSSNTKLIIDSHVVSINIFLQIIISKFTDGVSEIITIKSHVSTNMSVVTDSGGTSITFLVSILCSSFAMY